MHQQIHADSFPGIIYQNAPTLKISCKDRDDKHMIALSSPMDLTMSTIDANIILLPNDVITNYSIALVIRTVLIAAYTMRVIVLGSVGFECTISRVNM